MALKRSYSGLFQLMNMTLMLANDANPDEMAHFWGILSGSTLFNYVQLIGSYTLTVESNELADFNISKRGPNACTTCNTLGSLPLYNCMLTMVGWLVGFVALRPKSTAMVIAGRSVHLTTLFPGQA